MKKILGTIFLLTISFGCSSNNPRVILKQHLKLTPCLTKIILEKPIESKVALETLCFQVSKNYSVNEELRDLIDSDKNIIVPQVKIISEEQQEFILGRKVLVPSDPNTICFVQEGRLPKGDKFTTIDLMSNPSLEIEAISWHRMSK